MGWLARLFGATPRQELKGLRLDTSQAFWELSGRTDFPHLLRALADLLPEGSILNFEGGSPTGTLLDFLDAHQVPEQSHIAVGTLWPRPDHYHVPATRANLSELAKLTETCAGSELAVHFHVYCDARVLLEWHDAFDLPVLLSGRLPENKVRAFAETLNMTLRNDESASVQ